MKKGICLVCLLLVCEVSIIYFLVIRSPSTGTDDLHHITVEDKTAEVETKYKYGFQSELVTAHYPVHRYPTPKKRQQEGNALRAKKNVLRQERAEIIRNMLTDGAIYSVNVDYNEVRINPIQWLSLTLEDKRLVVTFFSQHFDAEGSTGRVTVLSSLNDKKMATYGSWGGLKILASSLTPEFIARSKLLQAREEISYKKHPREVYAAVLAESWTIEEIAEGEAAVRAREAVEAVETKSKETLAGAFEAGMDAIEGGRLTMEEWGGVFDNLVAAEKAYVESVKKAAWKEVRKDNPVTLGMATREVYRRWGAPRDINRSTGSWGVHEQWCYGNTFLYFENGTLTSFQD